MKSLSRLFLVFIVTTGLVYPQDFTVLNSKAGFDHFKSVHFESGSIGFACGNNGSIYKTTDGGDNWTKQVSGTTLTLYSIYFIDTQLGFAVSGEDLGGAIVLKTTNGGNTWTTTTLEGIGILYSVFFVNATTGWVGGSNGILYTTTNSGETWTEQTSNMVQTTRNGDESNYTDDITDNFDIYSIYFSSVTTGYIAGKSGRICATTDGGITWVLKNPVSTWGWSVIAEGQCIFEDPETGDCMDWEEDTYGWVESLSSPAGGNTFNSIFANSLTMYGLTSGNLYSTVDGGSSWNELWNHGGSSICFADGTTGFIANEFSINKTNDGGSIWTGKASGTGGYNKNYSSVFCTSTDDAFAVGDNGRVISTQNGGAAWNTISGATTSFYGIDMLNATSGYIVGLDTDEENLFAIIRKTTDGGVTWELNKQFTALSKQLYALDFVNENLGFAVGVNNDQTQGFIAKTTNGGSDWTSMSISDVSYLYSIVFTTSTTGYAVGHLTWTDGKILYTADGGASWNVLKTVTGKRLRSICFVDALNGFIAGDDSDNNGYVLKTIDGGATWSDPILVSSLRYLNAVYFISSSIGFVAGYGGVIFKTIDGGATWNPPTVNPSTQELNSIKFYDTNNGFCVGYNGEFLKTTDGGDTWTKLGTNVTQNLMAVSIFENILWTCGESSVILKNNTGFSLPVEITSFTASKSTNTVTLQWQTATEVNNYGFDVERAACSSLASDNVWTKIGFIQGHGNSNSTKNYFFDDTQAPSGRVSYRLKQIDFNGAFKYCDIVELNIDMPTQFSLSQNHPNPFNPTTIIKYQLAQNSTVVLKIFNTLGKEVATLVNEHKPVGSYEVSFTAGNLASGVYFYQIQTEHFNSVKKMILLR